MNHHHSLKSVTAVAVGQVSSSSTKYICLVLSLKKRLPPLSFTFLLLTVAVTHNIIMNPCFSLPLILTGHGFTPLFPTAMFRKIQKDLVCIYEELQGCCFHSPMRHFKNLSSYVSESLCAILVHCLKLFCLKTAAAKISLSWTPIFFLRFQCLQLSHFARCPYQEISFMCS
jgi:hypothetical protein